MGLRNIEQSQVLAVLVCSGAVPIQKSAAAVWGGQSVLQDLFMFEANMSWSSMESCKADVQRLSLLIKAALRNITNYPKEQKGGSVQLKGEIPAGRFGSAFAFSFTVLQPRAATNKCQFSFPGQKQGKIFLENAPDC